MRKNYRDILKLNERKTTFVIFTFILLYIFIGLLGDILMVYGINTANVDKVGHLSFKDMIINLITFKVIPYFTIFMSFFGVITVLITLKFYDNIMLFGTNYIELNPDKRKFSLKEQQLYNTVDEMRIAAGLGYMPKVYFIDADYMNAFASGYSQKSAMVAMTRGLIEKLDRSEIQAVIAHEISHIKHMDIKLTLFISVLSNIMLLVVDWLYHTLMFSSSKKSSSKDSGGNAVMVAYLIIILLRILLPIINVFLVLYLSRTREYMADAGAIQLTRDQDALGNALIKIEKSYKENKYEDEGVSVRASSYIFNPAKALIDSFSTHPSLESRLKAMNHSSLQSKSKDNK